MKRKVTRRGMGGVVEEDEGGGKGECGRGVRVSSCWLLVA